MERNEIRCAGCGFGRIREFGNRTLCRRCTPGSKPKSPSGRPRIGEDLRTRRNVSIDPSTDAKLKELRINAGALLDAAVQLTVAGIDVAELLKARLRGR
jgi:hypothetical protein